MDGDQPDLEGPAGCPHQQPPGGSQADGKGAIEEKEEVAEGLLPPPTPPLGPRPSPSPDPNLTLRSAP